MATAGWAGWAVCLNTLRLLRVRSRFETLVDPVEHVLHTFLGDKVGK